MDPTGVLRLFVGNRPCVVSLLMLATLAAPTGPALAQDPFVVTGASAAARLWGHQRDLLWVAGQALALALPAALLFTGLGARLARWLDRLSGRRRWLTATLFAGAYAVMFVSLRLPVSAARQLLAEPFGLAAPGWAAWAAAQVQGAGPVLAGAVLLGWAPYLLFDRSPRRWPLWAGVLILSGAIGFLYAQPARENLRPIRDPALHASLTRLASRAGASEVRAVLRVADRGRPCGGATVIGLGPSKVLAIDTALLSYHPRREVAQVLAHELKHYVRQDDWKAIYVIVALTVSGLAVLYVGSAFAMAVWSRRFGFASLADPASLPLLVGILTLFSLAGGAAFHRYGRHVEQEADRFALELTGDGPAQAALMQRYLRCTRLKDPDTSWIQQTFQRNHPSFRARIEFARDHRVAVR